MNPLYKQLGNKAPMNPTLQRFLEFKKTFNGNPQQTIQGMLNSGRISQEGGMSYARQNRDARGRYSREPGYSYARGERGSRGGRGGYSRAGGYSYGNDTEEKVELLREMMQEAGSEEERRALNKIIRRMEQE